VFGSLAIGNSLGSALGPYLSRTIYDLTGSYLAIFVTALGVIVTATLALLVFLRTAHARRPELRRREPPEPRHVPAIVGAELDAFAVAVDVEAA